jgi:predicted TIM-barrel fold metal-dependent hydrolase
MHSPSLQLIGIEEHFLTPSVRDAWSDSDLAATDPSVAFHSGAIAGRLFDLAEGRLALMDETGLDVQVLSLTTPMLHDLGPESLDLARRVNDAVAGVIARHPTRFQALATLPVAMPEEAARELERCIKTLGFKGTMLCGRVAGRNLDHPTLSPIFECAEELGVPILLHPRTPDMAVRAACYAGFRPEVDAAFATYGLGWHYDAGLQFIRLVLAGTFDRMPRLQVILGHWGELVLFYAERLAAMDRVSGLAHPIATYLRRNLYVTASGMFLPHYLERAAAVVGTDRLLFSTDFPYQYRPGSDAGRFLENCGLAEPAKAGFAHANWLRLTGGCTAQTSAEWRTMSTPIAPLALSGASGNDPG